jgi:SAM-dependent methyltransferase
METHCSMRVQNSELYSNAYLKLWQKGYVKDKAYWVVKPSSLLKEMPLPSNSKNGERFVAFDLLCGQGRNIQFLIEMGYEVFSIDILPEAISSVRTSFSANVNPVCSDAIDFLTDCKSLSVDLLFANHLIQHLITFMRLWCN